MNIAALDADGVIVSIVEVDDMWWSVGKEPGLGALKYAGFEYYEPGTVGPKEIERRITSWGEFDEWIATLQPA